MYLLQYLSSILYRLNIFQINRNIFLPLSDDFPPCRRSSFVEIKAFSWFLARRSDVREMGEKGTLPGSQQQQWLFVPFDNKLFWFASLFEWREKKRKRFNKTKDGFDVQFMLRFFSLRQDHWETNRKWAARVPTRISRKLLELPFLSLSLSYQFVLFSPYHRRIKCFSQNKCHLSPCCWQSASIFIRVAFDSLTQNTNTENSYTQFFLTMAADFQNRSSLSEWGSKNAAASSSNAMVPAENRFALQRSPSQYVVTSARFSSQVGPPYTSEYRTVPSYPLKPRQSFPQDVNNVPTTRWVSIHV